jgi:alpha-tubulin suppressor-like RCC1 family protein
MTDGAIDQTPDTLPPVPDAGDSGILEKPDMGMASLCGVPCQAPFTCIVVNDVAMCGCDPDAGLLEMDHTCVENTCLGGGGCDPHATCQLFSDAGHSCTCNGPQYFGDGTSCSIDYCYNPTPPDGGSTSNGTCPPHSMCVNGSDAGICNCDPGFAISGDGTQCLSEICHGLPGGGEGCPLHATCLAATDEGQCQCNENYSTDGDGGCAFVSICGGLTPPICPAYSHCDDEPDAGTYSCDCNPGYDPTGVPGGCVAEDYCRTSPCPSCTVCGNLPDAGTYQCTPNEGYYLDAGSCALINACGAQVCDTNATCIGTSCVCNADAGYHGSGTSCHNGYSQIALGGYHACSITDDGALWCWGQQCQGQLGNGYASPQCGGSDQNQSEACPGPVGTSKNWTQVAAGGSHTCALQANPGGGNTLWCWGDNQYAQLGYTTNTAISHDFNADVPMQVGTATDWVKVAASYENTCAINSSGELYCWGDNTYGQLCNGTTSTPTGGISPGLQQITIPATATSGAKWAEVAMGDEHTCAVDTAGELWCCGDNDNGQIGTTSGQTQISVGGFTKQATLNMTKVTNSSSTAWTTVGAGGGAVGYGHTCAVDSTGAAWCWGDNTFGQIGNGSSGGTQPTPALVSETNPAMDMMPWKSIQSGPMAAHTCGTRVDNTIWCWGLNHFNGQLGIGAGVVQSTVPAEVQYSGTALPVVVPSPYPETGFGVGSYFSCGVGMDGTGWCWGNDSYGELGDCLFNNVATPNATN